MSICELPGASKGALYETATGFTAPCTAPAVGGVALTNAATPTLDVVMGQAAPLLAAGGSCLKCYATAAGGADAPTQKANSLMVARPATSSLPLSFPTGSLAGASGATAYAAHTQVAAADAIACPTITATSVVKTWLAGLSNVAYSAIAAATVTGITPGTGFTLNGTIGAIYGYEVMYA